MKPWTVSLEVSVSRNRKVAGRQLINGLVGGALWGPGLIIDSHDGSSIRFRRGLPASYGVPDEGYVEIASEERGLIGLKFHAVYRGVMIVHALLIVGLCALVAGGMLLTSLPWPLALVVVFVVAPGAIGLAWRRIKRIAQGRISAFVHNTTYLESI